MEEKTNIEILEKRLVELRNQPRKKITNVSWAFHSPEVDSLNESLARASDEDRLELTKELFSLYCSEDVESAKKLFGDINHIGPTRMMGTIAAQGKQFRIWHSIPRYYSGRQADSFEEGLIFGVYGDSQDVRQYADTLMPSMQEAELPNGVKILMKY